VRDDEEGLELLRQIAHYLRLIQEELAEKRKAQVRRMHKVLDGVLNG